MAELALELAAVIRHPLMIAGDRLVIELNDNIDIGRIFPCLQVSRHPVCLGKEQTGAEHNYTRSQKKSSPRRASQLLTTHPSSPHCAKFDCW